MIERVAKVIDLNRKALGRSYRRWRSATIVASCGFVITLALAACGGGDEAAVEASVAATVEAMTALTPEPTSTPEAPTPVPEPTVDPAVLRDADTAEGEELAAAFLAERELRSGLTEEIERLSAVIVERVNLMRAGDENGSYRSQDFRANVVEFGFERAMRFSNTRNSQDFEIDEFRETVQANEAALVDLDTDGADPEFELLKFFRETPGSPVVDLEDITPDRLRLEIQAAVETRADARAEQGQ